MEEMSGGERFEDKANDDNEAVSERNETLPAEPTRSKKVSAMKYAKTEIQCCDLCRYLTSIDGGIEL
jgi:hypothetical protein